MKRYFSVLCLFAFLFSSSMLFSLTNMDGYVFSDNTITEIPKTKIPDKNFIPDRKRLYVAYKMYRAYITTDNKISYYGLFCDFDNSNNKYFYDYVTYGVKNENIYYALQVLTYFYNTIDSPENMLLKYHTSIYYTYINSVIYDFLFCDYYTSFNALIKLDIFDLKPDDYTTSFYFDENNNLLLKLVHSTKINSKPYTITYYMKPDLYQKYNNKKIAKCNISVNKDNAFVTFIE